MKFQRKPPTIDAFQWAGDITALNDFLTSINAPTVSLVIPPKGQPIQRKSIRLHKSADDFHDDVAISPNNGDWIVIEGPTQPYLVMSDLELNLLYTPLP